MAECEQIYHTAEELSLVNKDGAGGGKPEKPKQQGDTTIYRSY